MEIIRHEGHAVRLTPEGTALIDGQSMETYSVENDYYYVLGDNLHNSYDSRYWGFVSEDDLIGEVLLVYWSWHRGSSPELLSEVSSIRWKRIGSLVR
jgi:signal peptidase I